MKTFNTSLTSRAMVPRLLGRSTVSKKLNAPYHSGPSKTRIKIKNLITAVCPVRHRPKSLEEVRLSAIDCPALKSLASPMPEGRPNW